MGTDALRSTVTNVFTLKMRRLCVESVLTVVPPLLNKALPLTVVTSGHKCRPKKSCFCMEVIAMVNAMEKAF